MTRAVKTQRLFVNFDLTISPNSAGSPYELPVVVPVGQTYRVKKVHLTHASPLMAPMLFRMFWQNKMFLYRGLHQGSISVDTDITMVGDGASEFELKIENTHALTAQRCIVVFEGTYVS